MNIIVSYLVVAGLNSFILLALMLGMKSVLRVGWGKEEFMTATGLVFFGVVVYALRLYTCHVNVESLTLNQVLLLGAWSQGVAVLVSLFVLIMFLASAFSSPKK